MIKTIILGAALLLTCFTPLSTASESLLWVGYNQNTSDFFDDGGSQIKPDGMIVGFSTELSESFILTLSYGDFKGDTSQTLFENDRILLENFGETESSAAGVSLSWLSDDYGLTLSYGQLDNKENTMLRFPLVNEKIVADEQILSFSYDRLILTDTWVFGWSVGTQYAESDVRINDLIGDDPVIEIDGLFNSESWSTFVDLDISRTIETEIFSVTPQFTLSWNWEVSNSGEELISNTRVDERFAFNPLNDRLATTFRTPDSGFWELGVEFGWENGWSAALSYGQSIAAEVDVDSVSFNISVSF